MAIKVGSARNYLQIQRLSPTLRKNIRILVAFPEMYEMRFLLPDQVSLALGSFRWFIPRCWIVHIVIVVCFSLTLNVAAASCGDYLHGMGAAEGFLVQAYETKTTDLTLIQREDRRKPRECSGPACRQAPAIPADQPQPFPTYSPIKEICLHGQRDAVTDEIWVGVEPRLELDLKSPASVRLERPPQLG